MGEVCPCPGLVVKATALWTPACMPRPGVRRRTISARNSEAPLSFIFGAITGAELDFVILGAELNFVMLGAELDFVSVLAAGVRVWSGCTGPVADSDNRAGVTGCPCRVRAGTVGEPDFDWAR